MKRYGLILVSLLLVVSMLAACSNKSTPTATTAPTATKTPVATSTTAPTATKTPATTATTAPTATQAPTTTPTTTPGTQTPPTGALSGIELVRSKQCHICHKISATEGGVVAPSWVGIFGKTEVLTTGETITVNEAYIIESIRTPDAKTVKNFLPGLMAGFLTNTNIQISDEELKKIVDYIKSL